MGCDRKKEKKSEESSCNNKVRHREKSPKSHFKECNCVQATEKCPFENLPPPAAPGGREDLWELQFCRWWGWNWVKKPTEKCSERKSTENDQFPVKLPCAKSKKATFCAPIPKPCPAVQISPKEQFKTMCKCLLGRKKAPNEMANLYNTPSTSQIALQSEERVRYGVGTICKNPKKCSKKNKTIECHSSKNKRENTKYFCEDSTTVNSTMSEESEPKKAENCIISSTEESVEYLTIKLQQQQIGKNLINCPCLNNNNKEPKNKESIRNCAAASVQKNSSEKEIIAIAKNTQTTCSTTENNVIINNKDSETNNNNNLQSSSTTNYTEKLIKLKGKKHKTICIMVCCCGSCNNNNNNHNNNKPMEKSNSMLKNDEIISAKQKKCICKNCPKLCWQNNNLIDLENADDDDDEETKYLCNCCKKNKENLKNDITTPKCAATNNQLQNVATFIPIHHNLNNTIKKFEKFGTPTKNYQWMEPQTDSNITRTSLLTTNNNNNNNNNSSNIYDWLENELHNKKSVNFLENLNKISPRSDAVEERILLDAICDAILQEHEDKTNNYFFDEFKLNNCAEIINTTNMNNNNNYKDFGILCNLKNEEFHSDNIFHSNLQNNNNNNKEDVGVQIVVEKNKSTLLENFNYSDDGFLNTILENIYSWKKSENNVEEIAKNSQSRKSIKRELSASEDFSEDTKKKVKRDNNNNNNNTSIDSIFSRIDDIVLKSKEKTAEIQKVLNYSSDHVKKTERIEENWNNQPEEIIINNNNKRNYPMSSDNFKGSLYENNVPSFYQNNELLPKISCCGGSNTIILNRKNSMDKEILNEKLSKLSINSFVVFNEKSTVDLSSSCNNNNNNNIRIIKKKNNTNNNSNKISLIPIKK